MTVILNKAASMDLNSTYDDHVDVEIREMLNLEQPGSFFLFAGAGSGKTRTLIAALKHLAKTYKDELSRRGRQVAVITYTNAACDEISRRIDADPLFIVSTIHSFSWQQIQSFNSDIRKWLRVDLQESITKLEVEENKGRAGTAASVTRLNQIESKKRRLDRLDGIKTFTYSPSGNNRERNALNHSEIIKIFSEFLLKKPLMQRIFVQKYPFLLIDESQDTSKQLIEALFAVQQAHSTHFSLGLIGDSMQRIYSDGKEKIETEIPNSWATPVKQLNHRCPKRIVRLINLIREPADKQSQIPRDDAIEGWARLFVLPDTTEDKPAAENMIRQKMATLTNDRGWNQTAQYKVLTLEHHMAAKRMGFQALFNALAEFDDFRTGLLDGTLGATKFFTHSVLPLVTAQKSANKFATAKIVRQFSPLLSSEALKTAKEPRKQGQVAQRSIDSLMALWSESDPKLSSVLENIAQTKLFEIPDNLRAAAAAHAVLVRKPAVDETLDPLNDEIKALVAFLDCPFSVIPPYADYVSGQAEFDTHQGVKGLEFDRVMVLMDDSEAKGFMFGYERLLGAKVPTATDLSNARQSKETSMDRTRRLFYVTCSRAKTSLALVAYSTNPAAIKDHVIKNEWFAEHEVVTTLS
jgi:DNA helicase II / ATP-dependent DNA helicase PcrA